VDDQPPMHLVHRFLFGKPIETFDKPVNLRPQIAFEVIFRDHRWTGVGKGINPHDVEIATAGVKLGTATMTNHGRLIAHNRHCT